MYRTDPSAWSWVQALYVGIDINDNPIVCQNWRGCRERERLAPSHTRTQKYREGSGLPKVTQ